MPLITKAYYNRLIDQLKKYEDQYYNQNESEISDSVFDSLYREAAKIEKIHPNWIRKDSPINSVMGSPTEGLSKIIHDPPMLSLSKAMDYNELKEWLLKLVNKGYNNYIIECKHDGLAAKLIYRNGKLVLAATRGNGRVGSDVSIVTNQIDSIPKQIDINKLHSDDIDKLEVRGEIFLTKSGLDQINQYLQVNFPKEKLRKNVRNTASGLLKNEHPDINQSKYLRFSAYMSIDQDSLSHYDSMIYLKSLGFEITNDFVPFKQFIITRQNFNTIFDEIKKYIDTVYASRENLDLDIDGMVIKANNYIEQKQLGEKESVPNWAIAYKFPQEEKMSILNSVVWTLGSKGNITPVGNIEPVDILGVTVSNVTLHNIEEIRRLDLKINDHIIITRRGDVIPKVIKVNKELRTGNEIDIEIPSKCPICNGLITKNDVFIRCNNDNCLGRIIGKIDDFIAKLDIKDVGHKIVEKLVNAGKLKTIGDLYRLKTIDISLLEREGDISAAKVISRINDSRKAPLFAVIAGLGIPNIGDISGKLLANKYQSLVNLKNAKFEDLISLNDIGETTALNIVNWIKNNETIIDDLISLNLGIVEEKNINNILNNQTFAFTGTLSTPRKEMSELIEQNGGIVSSIKKGLNYLIIGEGAVQSKIDKAIKNNAKVINEQQFLNMIK